MPRNVKNLPNNLGWTKQEILALEFSQTDTKPDNDRLKEKEHASFPISQEFHSGKT